MKFAKSLTQAGAPWGKVVWHELESVPLSPPSGFTDPQRRKLW